MRSWFSSGGDGSVKYFLDFLENKISPPDAPEVEYRLACSGEFYRANVRTFDWRKSDLTRRLLTDGAFKLYVVSRPFEDYPQELCLRFRVGEVTESQATPFRTIVTFRPDEDIAEGFCAIATLLSRRLVSVVAKTRENHADELSKSLYGSEIPMPIVNAPIPKAWTPRPGSIVSTASGTSFKSNSPPAVSVDSSKLSDFFETLPTRKDAQDVVHAAQLYMSALELIEQRPDTAYLALVSAAETLSAVALPGYRPTDTERLELHKQLRNHAIEKGIDAELARELALLASERDHWISRKFKKFCSDFCPYDEIAEQDAVHLLSANQIPPASKYKKALGDIYSARSKHLHGGTPFPRGVGLGMQPWIAARDVSSSISGPAIPPVPWFERVVATAARRYLLGENRNPFQ